MANPLTLYVPVSQNPLVQAALPALAAGFVQSVKQGLDDSNIVHYARLALIPNLSGQGIQAICLITTFDKAMNPYLEFFWKNKSTRDAFAGIAKIALNPPNPPVGDSLTAFEKFINGNNLNKPTDLYQAYPQTVATIKEAFKPKAPTKPPTKGPTKSTSKSASKGGSKKGGSKKSR
jgi:hypothetical protein